MTDTRTVQYLDLDTLRADPRNPKGHAEGAINDSIARFGVLDPIVRDERTGYIVSGHGRRDAFAAMRARGDTAPEGVTVADDGTWLVPVVTGWSSRSDSEAAAALIALNRTTELGGWVDDSLLTLLDGLADIEGGLVGVGFDTADIDALRDTLAETVSDPGPRPSLEDRFVIPPFSILDARSGRWRQRKARWMALGIQSELGRVDDDGDAVAPRAYKGQESLDAMRAGRTLGQGLNATRDPKTGRLVYHQITGAGISIFDPVLCELVYRWFSGPGATVLDPFAGGSVRGVVAGLLGRPYVGVELRGVQVEANRAQASDIVAPAVVDGDPAPVPVWHVGDSLATVPTLDVDADLIFSCPPYADLEVYSDDPADLSNMPYADFLTAYRGIIAAACDRLRPDRFAVWTVGEVRESRGHGAYRGLVADTIHAFESAGLDYYGEAILATPAGSLPMRAGKQFDVSRKLGKTHQNVLVFVKGDARAATDACGLVEVEWPGEDEDED